MQVNNNPPITTPPPQQQQNNNTCPPISMNTPSSNPPSSSLSSFNNNKYSNLPPDHILNKQHSKISIKQVQKPTQPCSINNNNNIPSSSPMNVNIAPQVNSFMKDSSETPYHQPPPLPQQQQPLSMSTTSTSPTTLILPTLNNNNSITLTTTNTNTTTNSMVGVTSSKTTTPHHHHQVDIHDESHSTTNYTTTNHNNNHPPPSMNTSLTSNLTNQVPTTPSITNHTTTSNNNSQQCISQIPSSASTNIPKNTMKFLVDTHSMKLLSECNNTTTSNSYFHIRIGNSKQLEMEITRHANRIKYFSNSCVYDIESQTKNWSHCFRIESEYIDDKPLLYIPITGSIQLNIEIPNMDIHLHDDHSVKYDLRWCIDCASHSAGCILLPIRYGYNCVLLLKMMRLEYVEFIAVKSVDLYYYKSLVGTNHSNTINTINNTTMNQVMSSANTVMNSVMHSLVNLHQMQSSANKQQNSIMQPPPTTTTSLQTVEEQHTSDKMDTSNDLDCSKLQSDESLSQ